MNYIECANKYIGTVEGSVNHHAIIDYYNNNIKPLPRGYKVKYTDAWCATFASVIMKMCGAYNAPYECSVIQMYKKAKSHGQIINNPVAGDFVIYDWKNNGTLDHVGIIESVSGNTLKVVEGNYNHAVKTRQVSKKSSEIECFFRVPCAESVNINTNNDNIDKVVNDVIKGKYGNGNLRKQRLSALGYNYAEIQKLVNAKLRG